MSAAGQTLIFIATIGVSGLHAYVVDFPVLGVV